MNGTESGTIDWEEKKAGNPERWNAFQSRLTYTCPIGFVIEIPGRRDNEQQDPIPVEQESFEVEVRLLQFVSTASTQVECWDDAVWKPIPLHGGHVMPTCIRKLSATIFHSLSLSSHQLHTATFPCKKQ